MGRYAGQNIYYSAVKKSGVRRKGGIHLLRHSFATHLMESGKARLAASSLLGRQGSTGGHLRFFDFAGILLTRCRQSDRTSVSFP
jgi:site-specific recombinase XerC